MKSNFSSKCRHDYLHLPSSQFIFSTSIYSFFFKFISLFLLFLFSIPTFLIHHLPYPHLRTYPHILTSTINCICLQLSKGKTQCPFTRSPGDVQCVSFHPSRPFLFVATQTAVKVYHLIEQKLVKKLLTACKWISSIDMHPSGDHVIIGSYDRR